MRSSIPDFTDTDIAQIQEWAKQNLSLEAMAGKKGIARSTFVLKLSRAGFHLEQGITPHSDEGRACLERLSSPAIVGVV